jgi:diaminopimelate decarboxylase
MPNRTNEFSRYIGYRDGDLVVEQSRCVDLIERFGTPLYVMSEAQIHYNVKAAQAAFRCRYPDTGILFATKANNNLAVRRVFTQAGAGAECNGLGELLVSLHAGTPPELMVLNGWPKTEVHLRLAISNGIKVHLDSVDEFGLIARVARDLKMPVQLGIRTRLMLDNLNNLASDWPGAGLPTEGHSVGANMRQRNKDGVSEADIPDLYRQAERDPWIDLAGLHYHIGRIRGDTSAITAVIDEQAALAGRLRDQFGWRPRYLDLGGGLPFGRSEGHGPLGQDRGVPSYDEYAEDVTTALLHGLDTYDLGRPRLLVEPGRGLASNAGLLLSRVQGRKYVPETGQTWLVMDASQTQLMNSLTGGWRYHPVPVKATHEPPIERVNIVDSQPWYGNLAFDETFPPLTTGDALAFLDTGAYGETKAVNFNMVPRPATVLVLGTRADVITRRETVEDLLQRVQIPELLIGEGNPSAVVPAVGGVAWPLPSWARVDNQATVSATFD